MDFDWKIRGGHKQETREGYNLLDFNVTQNSKVTVNEDGTLTINGAGGFGLNIDKLQLKAGITYYQKVELISGSISGANINNTFLSFAGAGKWISSEIFTESSFNEDTEKTVIWINASATFDNAVIKIWANTNKSDFEQYGAAPSPDYPSEVETVGNNINFINMEDSEEKILNGMTYSIKNNVLKIKGTATANTTLIFNSKTSVDLKVNGYTLNANKNGSLTGTFGYYIYGSTALSSAKKVLIDGGNLASSTNTGIKTQILTDDYYNCRFAIYFAKSCTANMTLTPKLEKGSVATPWSPYRNG